MYNRNIAYRLYTDDLNILKTIENTKSHQLPGREKFSCALLYSYCETVLLYKNTKKKSDLKMNIVFKSLFHFYSLFN